MRLKWDNVGKGLEAWGNAYKERNKRDEIEALKIESEKGLGYTDEQAKYLHEAASQPNAEVRFENNHYIVDTPGSAGQAPVSSSVRPTDRYDTGRFSLGGQAYDSLASAENARMGRMADVYRKYGDDSMARQMERDAYQMGRDAEADRRWGITDARARETHNQQTQLAGLQIDAAKRTEAENAAWDTFNAARSQLQNPDDPAAINALAKTHLNYSQQLKLVGDMTQMGEHKAKLLAQSITEKVRNAGNLAGLAIAFRDDPDLDPGSYFEYRTDPKTRQVQVQFFNADKTPRGTPIQYGSEAEAYYSLGKSAVDPASIYTFLREQQDRALKNAQTQSEIDKNKAMANNYNAEAWYARAGKPKQGGAGAAGGLGLGDVKHVTGIAANAAQLWAKAHPNAKAFMTPEGTYRTTAELDAMTESIAMDIIGAGKIPTPEGIVAIMRAASASGSKGNAKPAPANPAPASQVSPPATAGLGGRGFSTPSSIGGLNDAQLKFRLRSEKDPLTRRHLEAEAARRGLTQ